MEANRRKVIPPLQKLALRRQGVPDEIIGLAEELGIDWLTVLIMFLEVGIPILLDFLKGLRPPTPAPAPTPAP